MYTGTKPVAELEDRAPTMPDLDTGPLTLDDVTIVTVTYEAAADVNEAMLPPSLHPTIPPIVTWVAWRCPASPAGPFTLVQTRIGCRSGVRPRGFLVKAVIDNAEAAAMLSQRWGFACAEGHVEVDVGYDRTVVAAAAGHAHEVLRITAVDPVPLRPDDIQWIANMHLAHTPRGLRLVQVDPEVAVTRAERARPRLECFDAAAWGEPLLRPVHPVAATVAQATLTLPRIRYLCRPEELAFVATEVVG